MKTRAAVLRETGKALEIEEIDVADPQAGEVRVRMQAAGVCHSDLHVMKGDLPIGKPIVMGHEGAGVIESVGEGVRSVAPGDQVILLWRVSCGKCRYCTSGRPALCDLGTEVRRTGKMADGKTRFHDAKGEEVRHYCGVSTFSEFSTVPELAVLKIDPDFSIQKAALLGCGVITGAGAVFHAADVQPGSSVAVVGCGGIGLNVVQGARIRGAKTIIGVDVIDRKLEEARRMGATHVVNASGGDGVEQVMDLTDGAGVDFSFEAIGRTENIEQAYAMAGKAGKCIVVGIAPAGAQASFDVNQLVYSEKELIGSLYGSAQPRVDLPELMELHHRGELLVDELLTRTYTLDEINAAYDDLEKGKLARGLVVFGD